jgi:hypothetical protein
MIRKPLAALTVLAGLGLFCGCSAPNSCCCCSSNNGGFFSRLCGRTRTPTAAVPATAEAFQPAQVLGAEGAPCGCEGGGPVLADQVPFVMPGAPVTIPAVPTTPNVAPPPRLVPEPQAPIRSYMP